jgi:hypothetical protein
MLSAVLVAIVATHALAASPVYAQQASDPASPPAEVAWPSFTDALDEDARVNPPLVTHDAWTPPPTAMTSTSVVTAPLPQAVVAGLFMLGGNWVVTRMWKNRKI